MFPLFYRLPTHLKRTFQGRSLWVQLLMIVLTYLIVHSGFDWWYYVSTKNPLLFQALFPAVIIGGFIPMFGPFLLFLFALAVKNKRLVNTAWGLAQAALLGLGLSSFYKAFTGRAPPHLTNLTVDNSHGFHFGVLQGGVFWGWPSSHTTVAFAMAWTLIQLYPEKKWVKPLALLYAFYIGFGISISIHWFSEFVAGALLGTVLGIAIGQGFVQRFKAISPAEKK